MYELPKERLSTTDQTGKRIHLYPAAVRGFFRARKNYAQGFLLVLFLVLPWIHVGGRQLLLLDVAAREFYFFGLHFRAHDAPLVLFLFLGFTFGIGLVTAIWGRVWCGWACPQTVFIEFLFRRIERLVEGNHRSQRALDEKPLDSEKLAKKSLKWSLFVLVSLGISHSFLGYFVGTRELVRMVTASPLENWASFLMILGTTAVIAFDFGWFREQFCTIMCPYGRFQSVMMDNHSLIVAYDVKRGEPRRGLAPAPSAQGDCVNCLKCVQVCPTGIDIRRGLQMECIACTACIDACDEVMAKVKKPAGLIRYTSERELGGKKARPVRARSLAYAGLALVSLLGLGLSLGTKDFLDATVVRAQDSPYQRLPTATGEVIVNHFRLHLSNQTGDAVRAELILPPELKALGVALVMPLNPVQLDDGANTRADFFLRFPPAVLDKGSRKISLPLVHGNATSNQELTLVGPEA
jgi:cytochrome c oxidase accessory protein FixG